MQSLFRVAGCLILFSHVPNLYSEWSMSYILASSKEFNSLRLHYKNPTPFEWTYSEFILGPSGIRFILNLTLCPLEPGPITLTAVAGENSKKELQGRLFEGGEKILLVDEEAEWLITELLEHRSIQLSVDRYKTTLQPDRFKEMWSKAKHLLLTKKIAIQLK